ncbi:hypothetical protein [Alysiella crassa]|uniref:DUF4303 domain-containing protein n=1 Tax=Alysiella crassa TaxID=153491 RepID=A0A376BKH3_9NEIS|nr:hypothetical protein [Alysiella crassa]UOP07538.1 hypothetical protein LVJ80_03830 [Alysiella crassa]SSY70252.1 Uncharacterised protein [Alysiella crassa]
MNYQEIFADKIVEQIGAALAKLPQKTRDDVYALSFWVSGGDEWLPSLLVSYNTYQQVQENENNTLKQDDEAKWNFAYWLQDEAELFCVNLYQNNQELETWLQHSSFAYTEDEFESIFDDDGNDDVEDKSSEFYEAFVETQIAVVQRLFDENVIADVFGQNIPVIIHSLEYYDEPLSWTERANPKGLADEFLNYWRKQ